MGGITVDATSEQSTRPDIRKTGGSAHGSREGRAWVRLLHTSCRLLPFSSATRMKTRSRHASLAGHRDENKVQTCKPPRIGKDRRNSPRLPRVPEVGPAPSHTLPPSLVSYGSEENGRRRHAYDVRTFNQLISEIDRRRRPRTPEAPASGPASSHIMPPSRFASAKNSVARCPQKRTWAAPT